MLNTLTMVIFKFLLINTEQYNLKTEVVAYWPPGHCSIKINYCEVWTFWTLTLCVCLSSDKRHFRSAFSVLYQYNFFLQQRPPATPERSLVSTTYYSAVVLFFPFLLSKNLISLNSFAVQCPSPRGS